MVRSHVVDGSCCKCRCASHPPDGPHGFDIRNQKVRAWYACSGCGTFFHGKDWKLDYYKFHAGGCKLHQKITRWFYPIN